MTSPARYAGPFHVIETPTGKSIESHETRDAAERARDILNAHEEDHGRPTRYHVHDNRVKL